MYHQTICPSQSMAHSFIHSRAIVNKWHEPHSISQFANIFIHKSISYEAYMPWVNDFLNLALHVFTAWKNVKLQQKKHLFCLFHYFKDLNPLSELKKRYEILLKSMKWKGDSSIVQPRQSCMNTSIHQLIMFY